MLQSLCYFRDRGVFFYTFDNRYIVFSIFVESRIKNIVEKIPRSCIFRHDSKFNFLYNVLFPPEISIDNRNPISSLREKYLEFLFRIHCKQFVYKIDHGTELLKQFSLIKY